MECPQRRISGPGYRAVPYRNGDDVRCFYGVPRGLGTRLQSALARLGPHRYLRHDSGVVPCVIAGIVGKVIALGKHPNLSLALYLAMGWTALVIIVPMWRSMAHEAFWWVIAEGVFYTIGAYFFKHDEEHAYFHAIWHVFITLGAISHSIATWIILA